MRTGSWSAVAAAVTTIGTAYAGLPGVFGDHMVLQRESDVPVWGTATAGQQVIVRFAGQERTVAADEKGNWRVTLDPMPAANEGREMVVVAGDEETTFGDVVVGDVWLCSGQSNMAGNVGNRTETSADEFPLIRHYVKRGKGKGGEAAPSDWVPTTSQTVKGFTATGYFFGRHLHKALGVPIGLIKAAAGGTLIEPWTPKDAFLADPHVAELVQYQASPEFAKAVGASDEGAPKNKRRGPRIPESVREYVFADQAGGLYDAHIAPVVPYAIRGVIWYQGEANSRVAASARPYDRLLPLLIRSWRDRWDRDDLPFYYVQLPSIGSADRSYALVRDGMLRALGVLPNIGMSVNIDIDEGLHPKSKHIMGERLALLALRDVYGKPVDASGPLFKTMAIRDGRCVCSFTEVGDGLVVKGDRLTNFEIAGGDRAFRPADAAIEGDTVVVSSPNVAEPVAVRYAFSNNPKNITFCNKAGLPASPFRTDTW